MTRFVWGDASDIGRVRSANEDAALAVDGLFAVADGMGGHRGGDVASHLALEVLQERFVSAGTDVLVDAVQEANHAVVSQAVADEGLKGMGTTLCAMALVDAGGEDAIAVVNVGDSRLYLLSDGALTQITEDHSLVATMERQGRLTRAEAAVHPQRNILTRALGIDSAVLVDSWEIVPVVGDRYLICSDGLFNEVDDNRLAATLRRLADPTEAARELVRLANESGGRDNITCVVVDVVDATAVDASTPPSITRVSPVPALTAGAAARPVEVAADPPDEPRRRRRRDPDRPRSRFTWRVALFLVALVAVVAAAVGAVYWTGTSTYYVAVEGDQVAIFRGKPGGVLWISPELVEVTALSIDQVPPASRLDVEAGREQATLDDARRYVANLFDQISMSTTTTTSTTTTVPTTAVPFVGLDPGAPDPAAPDPAAPDPAAPDPAAVAPQPVP
ncbi:MAG: Stp1/IreP family PP2C-type Ser/Thr phosphatase [Acidimicrobiales bacterium]|nr:Stp1/IreP family PP2C-type Ser/Thr phosphatase [Acidimicrobiales bacterium]